MKNQNLSTKILLTLLVVGVWGLLLKPVVSPAPVVAQPTTKAPTRVKPSTEVKSAASGKVVLVAGDYEGNLLRDRANFVARINAYEAKGYRIVGYQTAVENNNTYHYALLERK